MDHLRTIPKPNPIFSVRKSIFASLWQKFVRVVNFFLVFFSLRKRHKFWGIVYDSVTKQPLDPVMVKLVYVGETHVETSVTDLGGKYGFLARPGKFKILVKKTNYTFPSKNVQGDTDGIYSNLYHGEFFELAGDVEVVGPNIPMDPVRADWNQEAKLKVLRTHPYRDYLVRRLAAIFFWFGFIMTLVYVWDLFPHLNTFAIALMVWYGFLLILALVVPDDRLWGKINQHVLYDSQIMLELHNRSIEGVIFGKAEVLPGGKFFLRAGKGSYDLLIKYKGEDETWHEIGRVPVRVGGLGVVTTTLAIK